MHPVAPPRQVIACDFAVSCTGVVPCTDFARWESPPCEPPVGDHVASDGHARPEAGGFIRLEKEEKEEKEEEEIAVAEDAPSQDGPAAPLALDAEGAVIVDAHMRSTRRDVFAAGDCCAYDPAARHHWRRKGQGLDGKGGDGVATSMREDEDDDDDGSEDVAGRHWFQMRLWTQVGLGLQMTSLVECTPLNAPPLQSHVHCFE